MQKTTIRIALLTTIGFAIGTAPAIAGNVTYLTQSGYSTAIGTPTATIDFESLSQSSYTSPLIFQSFTFSNSYYTSGSPTISAPTSFSPGSGKFIDTGGALMITPGTGLGAVFGIGFNLGCYGCGGTAPQYITVDLNDGTSQTFNTLGTTIPSTTNSYWGVTTTTSLGIKDVNIYFGNPGNYSPSIDNVAYTTVALGGSTGSTGGTGGTSDTPEVGTFLLIGSGLAALTRYKAKLQTPLA